MDIFAAAGLKKPDISILSDAFLADIRGMPQRNLAVELLQKLLKGEIRTRRKHNVVQARAFAELLEAALRKYQHVVVSGSHDHEWSALSADQKVRPGPGSKSSIS